MTSSMRTWRLAAVAGLALGAFACSEAATDVVDVRGPELGPQLVIDLSNPAGGSINVNDAIWNFPVPFNVGTGQINPFLSVQAAPNEQGFNTDGTLPLDAKRPNFTNALPLNHVPTITGPGSALFREIILDANEANSGTAALFSIDRFDLWLCNDPGAATYTTRAQFQGNTDCALVYDIDNDVGGSDVDFIRATDEVTSGSGLDLDYQILIPEGNFIAAAGIVGADLTDCAYQGVDSDPCGAFLILDVRMGFQGGNLVTGSTFEETSTIKRPFVLVSKDADESFTRTHVWDIEKLVDIALHTLSTGETDSSEYTVNAIYVDSMDSDWAVSGEITIENPSDDEVQVDSIKDTISGVGLVPVVCPMTPPFTIASGATVVCTYSSDLPDGTDRTNTVEVHIQDLAVGTAMADIDFSEALISVIDETATVTDTFEGTLGGVAAPNDSSFMYTRSFTCDEDEGEYENIATITADDTGTMQKDTANVEVVCQPPDLMIEKEAENDTINAGETARFTITFWNDGPGTAFDAELTDSLPAGLDWSLDSYSPDPAAGCAISGVLDSEVLDCGPIDLAPDDSIVVTVSAMTSAEACAVYPNTAIGDADNVAEPVEASDTIVCQPPDLMISKTAENDTINAGETARFTIQLWNDGPGDAVDATINDPLPAGLTWSLDSSSPGAANCAVTGVVDSQELDCGPLTLAADDTITATVSAMTSFEACAVYPNTATGDADNVAEPVMASDTIVCLPPDLQISKTAENDTINAGETARFTIQLWNDGPGDAVDATINDPLPAGLTWSLDSSSPGAANCAVTGVVNSQELDCGPLTLAADDTITATVSATTSFEACAVYPNTATGDADNHAPVEASDTIVCIPPPMEDETAWASNLLGVPLVLLYNPGGTGNWATYVAYDGEKTVTLYAGQTQDVGTVHFSAPAGGMVTITIMLTGGTVFADGTVVAVQDYSSAPSGNPSPGQFDWKETPDSATMHTITVPQNNFYGVHTVVIP